MDQHGNCFSHIAKHLPFSPREAILSEIVKQWETHQDDFSFQALVRRLTWLKNSPTDEVFRFRVTEFILWADKEYTRMQGEIHDPVTKADDPKPLIPTITRMLQNLPQREWRITITADKKHVNLSEPCLNWRGSILPVEKCIEFTKNPVFKEFKFDIYFMYRGEPFKVQWLEENHGAEMSALDVKDGGFKVQPLDVWFGIPITAQAPAEVVIA